MIRKTFTLRFPLQLDPACIVSMQCRVEFFNHVYYVDNIRTVGQDNGDMLPPVNIRKVGGCWVHADSQKETELSYSIGRAVEETEQ